jgi:uncharacterized protein DUF4159
MAAEGQRRSRPGRRLIAAALLSFLVAAGTSAQRSDENYARDLDYDGRFTFVRLRWQSGSSFGYGRRGGMGSAWNHDYPRAEQHLTKILDAITYIETRTDGSRILTLDDPELFKYPIAMMWEPGFWVLNESEAKSFREYLLKGGFAIFDDFEYDQWNNFEMQMRRVLPDVQFIELDKTHQIFDTFFRMKRIDFPHPMYGILPTYYGIFEDNDPSKRLMVIANYNNDVAEYWEWSDTGLLPIDMSNEAYKLGVNYMVYAMTH